MKAFRAVGIVLLPFLLAACNEATPSTDARTEPPLVRVGTVSTQSLMLLRNQTSSTERMFLPIDPN